MRVAILVALCVSLSAATCVGAIASVASVKKVSPDAGTFTTDAIDTTGANLIVIHAVSIGAITPTDSKGNTYTGLTVQNSGGLLGRIFYCLGATVGGSHTFTLTGLSYGSMQVRAFSGVKTSSAFDVENGATTSGVATMQPGSVTPSEANCLVVACITTGANPPSNLAINGSYTNSFDDHNGSAYGGALAYDIQTTATATNPTWTWDNGAGGEVYAATIASFKAEGTPAATSKPQVIISRTPPRVPSLLDPKRWILPATIYGLSP